MPHEINRYCSSTSESRLICRPAKTRPAQAMLARVVELPFGEQAARLLDNNKRAQALFKEVESYYKRCSKKGPELSQAGAWCQVMCAVQLKIRTRFISTWLACFRFRNSWGVARLRFLFWNGPGQKRAASRSREQKSRSRNFSARY